jgi:hypothetical protein
LIPRTQERHPFLLYRHLFLLSTVLHPLAATRQLTLKSKERLSLLPLYRRLSLLSMVPRLLELREVPDHTLRHPLAATRQLILKFKEDLSLLPRCYLSPLSTPAPTGAQGGPAPYSPPPTDSNVPTDPKNSGAPPSFSCHRRLSLLSTVLHLLELKEVPRHTLPHPAAATRQLVPRTQERLPLLLYRRLSLPSTVLHLLELKEAPHHTRRQSLAVTRELILKFKEDLSLLLRRCLPLPSTGLHPLGLKEVLHHTLPHPPTAQHQMIPSKVLLPQLM